MLIRIWARDIHDIHLVNKKVIAQYIVEKIFYAPSLDSRLRGNDEELGTAVIPAKAGIQGLTTVY